MSRVWRSELWLAFGLGLECMLEFGQRVLSVQITPVPCWQTVSYLRKAAKKNHPSALNNLGWCEYVCQGRACGRAHVITCAC